MIIKLKENGKFNYQWELVLYPKESDEICIMHTNSHNIEMMMGSETDDIIKKHFQSLLQNYQKI